MTKEWTKEQQKAINHSEGSAIISASAGSGKTAVLVERVIKLITDGSDPIDPTALAVMTYTEKAAAEMRSRCFERISEMMNGADPKSLSFLKRQSKKLRNAKISTISSFCFSIIRENIDLSELSAGFSIIDETSSLLLKEKILDGVLEHFYKTASAEEKELISDHFINRTDAELKKIVLKIHDFSVSVKDTEKWLCSCENNSFSEKCKTESAAAARKTYAALKTAYDALCSEYAKMQEPKCNADAQMLRDTIIAFSEELASKDFCPDAPIEEKPKISNIPSKMPDCIKSLRQSVKDCFDALCVKCSALSVFDEENAEFLKVTKILIRIVRDFADAYKSEKLSRNTADFSDAEQGVLKMLCEHPQLKERIGLKAIIVDEFQDSNELQYEIFKRLSDDEKNLYLVGDIKQSIYSFRGAQPSVFANRLNDDNYSVLPMNRNFRSGKNIVDGANEIFDRLMTKAVGGADYKNESRLVFGREKNAGDGSPVEICKVVTEKTGDDGVLAEARYVADRIRSMIDEGYEVNGKPCEEKDFAIIIRSAGKKLPIYRQALCEYSLTAVSENKGSFTDIPEISIMLDLLSVIDDPYNDERLARVLMSPVFAFDTEDIARLRSGTVGLDIEKLNEIAPDLLILSAQKYMRLPLYTCLNAMCAPLAAASENEPLAKLAENSGEFFDSSKANKCRCVLAQLKRLRNAMSGSTPGELVRTIYDTTDTLEMLCAGKDFDSKSADLHLLERYAESFSENMSGGNIADFLADIKRLSESGNPLKCAGVLNANGVRIITAHSSKGLQYPICFVSNCQASFNIDDTKENIILSKKYGIAGKIVRKRLMSKIPSPSYSMIREEIKQELKSEEMRLMYVAATRAEEKLIFTGHGKKEAALDTNASNAAGSTEKNNMLEWLLSLQDCADDTKAMTDDGCGCFRYCGRLLFKNCSEPAVPENGRASDETLVVAADDAEKQRIKNAISYKYTDPVFTVTACKFTATELVKNRKLSKGSTGNCELYISRPDFSEEEKTLGGKAKGDAYHKAMEHIPFDKMLSESEAAAELDLMVERHIISQAERECISPADISAFFACDEAKRMIRSKSVKRECPIFHRLNMDMVSAYELGLEEDADISALKKDPPYIQGIADLFFVEEDGIIIIDYKTDSVSDASELVREYAFQLDIYSDALACMLSLPIKQKLIYSFALGRMIDVDRARKAD